MPRVLLDRKAVAKKDLSAAIIGKMKVGKKITQKDLGEKLGITQQACGKKIERCQFTLDDLMTVFTVLEFRDDEILYYMRGGRR